MGALGLVRAASSPPDDAIGVLDLSLVLAAAAVTCLLCAVALRAAARARQPAEETRSSGFTLARGASWLQSGAIALAVVALLILLWTLVVRVVEMD